MIFPHILGNSYYFINIKYILFIKNKFVQIIVNVPYKRTDKSNKWNNIFKTKKNKAKLID